MPIIWWSPETGGLGCLHPDAGPSITAYNGQDHFSEQTVGGASVKPLGAVWRRECYQAIRGSPRESSLSKTAPATCWFKTNRKKGNIFKKWIWGFSSSCQGSHIPRVFLCPLEFLGHVRFQGARGPSLLLITVLGAMGWLSGILFVEKQAKLTRLDASSSCEPPTLSTDTGPVAGKSSCAWQKPCHLGRNWAKSSKPSKTEQSRDRFV